MAMIAKKTKVEKEPNLTSKLVTKIAVNPKTSSKAISTASVGLISVKQDDDIGKAFNLPYNSDLLSQYIRFYQFGQRKGNAKVKTRGEVAGSGRKPWKQKHTGRARVGAARAPHWKGGGRVFGPHPRDYSYSMPKKARRLALDSAWLAKFQDKEIVVVEDFNIGDTPKTSVVVKLLQGLGVANFRSAVGILTYNDILWKSIRNIHRLSLEEISHFHPHLLIAHERIILTRKAFEELVQSRGGEVKSLKRQEVYPSKN